jgi:general secretion pathway protein I
LVADDTSYIAGADPESGFTILEVLIALTVLAMSMAVLLAVFSQGLDRAHASGLRAQARDLAQALLARGEATPPKSLVDSNGQSGALSWQVRLAPFGSNEDRDAWQFAPVTLTATVHWQDHGRAQSLSLSTLRLLPRKENS